MLCACTASNSRRCDLTPVRPPFQPIYLCSATVLYPEVPACETLPCMAAQHAVPMLECCSTPTSCLVMLGNSLETVIQNIAQRSRSTQSRCRRRSLRATGWRRWPPLSRVRATGRSRPRRRGPWTLQVVAIRPRCSPSLPWRTCLLCSCADTVLMATGIVLQLHIDPALVLASVRSPIWS